MQAPPLTRWLGFAGLCVAVLGVHLGLLQEPWPMGTDAGKPSQGRPPVLQVQVLPPVAERGPERAAEPLPSVPVPVPTTGAVTATSAATGAPGPTLTPPTEPAPTQALRLPVAPPAPAETLTDRVEQEAAVDEALPAPDAAAEALAATRPALEKPAPEPPEPPVPSSGTPAPAFVTMVQRARAAALAAAPQPSPLAVLPAEALLWRFHAQRGALSGPASLGWQPLERRYTAQLQVELGGRVWIDWASEGERLGSGLAPERMVERSRDKVVHAVNFQRDKGIISYAGPTRTDPLPDGVQDRLSWIVQLPALVRARGGVAPGDRLEIPVAGARGSLDTWVFEAQPPQQRVVGGLALRLTRLVREPTRPYDLRVQVWLSPLMDHLPVGLVWEVVPNGEPLSLWMVDLPVPR